MDQRTLSIPIRYYKDFPGGFEYEHETINLTLDQCAFLLIDVDYVPENGITQNVIAPALSAARLINMRVVFVHNDLRLVADEGNIVHEIWSKTKGGDGLKYWATLEHFEPNYLECVKPQNGEHDFPKWIWSGFHDTFLDQHLRANAINTLFVVGYSQRACLHYTIADAVGRNYRIILLRDCTWAPEMPDTIDPSLPEGGWINRNTLRNFEHLIGYTTLSVDFIEACKNLKQIKNN